MKPVVWFAVSLLITVFAFQNCGRQLSTGVESPSVIEPTLQKVQAPDCTFNRAGLLNGEEVVAYRVSTVPVGTTAMTGCESDSNKEMRKCENGILTGVFQFAKCQPGAPKSCVVDGITVAHGQGIKLYQVNDFLDSVPGCEGPSNWREVKCNDGRFDSNYPTYKYSLCQDRKQFDCKYDPAQPAIMEGNGKYFYNAENPTATIGCQREYRRCVNGKLQGTPSFRYVDCREIPGRKCTVPGQTNQIDHRQSVLLYPVASVPNGQVCPEASTRQCIDGTLNGNQAAVYASCAPLPRAACSLGTATVNDGQTVDAFTIPVAASQEICDQSKISRTCSNGVLSGNSSYRFPECQVNANALSCETNDGEIVLHGQTGNLFKRNLTISTYSTRAAYCADADNVRTLRCENGVFKTTADQAIAAGERVYKGCPGTLVELPMVKSYYSAPKSAAPYNNEVSCPEGKRAVGVYGNHNPATPRIYSLGLICEGGTRTLKIGSASDGTEFASTCPDQSATENQKKFMTGFYVRYSAEGIATRLDLHCAQLNGSAESAQQSIAGRDNSNPVAYRLCPGGTIVGKLRAETSTTVTGLRPPNVECMKVEKPAAINCYGEFGPIYCDSDGEKKKVFYEFRPQAGLGANCQYANEQVVMVGETCSGGSGGGGGSDPDPEQCDNPGTRPAEACR